MAFISEIHYRTSDVVVSDSATHEYVEITLAPGEDPADFVLSFYGNDGVLMDGATDNIEATGVTDGQVTLSDLVGVPDPENPGYTIYTVTGTSSVHELVNAGTSQVSDEANFIALTNIATNVVADAIGIGTNTATTLSGGAADGALTTNAPRVGGGQSVQFDSAGNNVSGPRSPDDSNIVCFCAGTQITVPSGNCSVEDLNVGDLVETLEHGPQPIRWIGRKRIDYTQLEKNPKLLPVRISQGSMGNNLPHRDLLVSRQHRMLSSSRITKGIIGRTTSLVAAIKLTELAGISVDYQVEKTEYFHILFDRHEVIFAEGAPAESLYLGQQAIQVLDWHARLEVYTLFPELKNANFKWTSAAYIPSNKEQKKLSLKHAQHNAFMLDQNWEPRTRPANIA
ncbi:MAG: Hint domain-containing protein [Sulfitobacter sp.]